MKYLDCVGLAGLPLIPVDWLDLLGLGLDGPEEEAEFCCLEKMEDAEEALDKSLLVSVFGVKD